MPVASETSRVQYVGNDSTTTPYSVPFYFLANADIRVVLTDAGGAESLLVESTHYTLTGAGGALGGSLKTTTAYDSAHTLTIYREPQLTQSADFQSTGALPADTLTRGLDKLTMLVQSLSRKLGRCFRLNDKADDVAALSEVTRANTVFGFDENGAPALQDRLALRLLVSLPGSVHSAPTAYWLNDGERGLKVPDFVGQLGVQLGNNTLWRSTAMGAGNWSPVSMTGMSGDLALTNIPDALVTYAKMQNISASKRLLGRNSALAGVSEEVTLSQLLDWIGSATQGDILYRGATSWERLAAGVSGQVLRTAGSGSNPSWEWPRVIQSVMTEDSADYSTTTTTPAFDNSIPQISEGTAVTNLSVTITPKSVSSILEVELVLHLGGSGALVASAAVFRDATASAVTAGSVTVAGIVDLSPIVLRKRVTAGSLAATTFSVRFSTNTATVYVNRWGSLADLFSTSLVSSLKVTEMAP